MRDRKVVKRLFIQDYFAANAKFGDEMYRRRFQISRKLLLRIDEDMKIKYPFLKQLMMS